MYGLIYCATNTVNGKKYVGQTVKSAARRWQFHLKSAKDGSACALHCAIRKYGAEVFELETIGLADTLDELNKKETYYIGRLKTLAPDGYNLTTGGEGRAFSTETLAKMSKVQMGKAIPEEVRLKLSASCKGKKILEITRRKLSEAAKGRALSDETKARISLSKIQLKCKRGHLLSGNNLYTYAYMGRIVRMCRTCRNEACAKRDRRRIR
jgi:group I intron endonuclease